MREIPFRRRMRTPDSRDFMQLTLRELRMARNYLRQAQALIVHVSFLVFNAGDSATASRLNDITARLTDEIEGIERLIETR
jgi:hypothetical protein